MVNGIKLQVWLGHAIPGLIAMTVRVGGCQVVFVRDNEFLKPSRPKVFHARMVRTGAKDATNMEIIVGVAPGEVVVSKGSALLADELKRNYSFAPIPLPSPVIGKGMGAEELKAD